MPLMALPLLESYPVSDIGKNVVNPNLSKDKKVNFFLRCDLSRNASDNTPINFSFKLT